MVNGFDENAVEAALQIKDEQGANITVISSGTTFALDVMKKPLSMGADELVLLQDDAFANSVATSSAFSSSAERSVEVVVDPSAFHIQVEVLNGCGVRGIGQQAMRFLRERGFDVVNIDNADHFEYRETVVLDRRGTDGPSEAARAVGNALGTQYVLLQRNDDRLVDVSVVIGKDYGELLFSVEND